MSRLNVLVPTRGRPQNVSPILTAWRATGAFSDGATLIFLLDEDDERCWSYLEEIEHAPEMGDGVSYSIQETWTPMVPKLNRAAVQYAESGVPIGFAGDDHLPRTRGWVRRYLSELGESPSIVSCPDGTRPDNLPTQWAMSAEIVRALGRMVPAPVEHLYCDNAVRDLAYGASCYRWLDDVLIEHMHPIAGKAEADSGYRKVNSTERYTRDRTAYAVWAYRGMRADVAKVQGLRGEISDGQ